MKGKPQGGAAGNIGSATLAYPGNSFRYSPKPPSDEPSQKLDLFDLTTIALRRGAANAASVDSNKRASASVLLSSTAQHHSELSKNVTDAGHSQKCNDIQSLSEKDSSGSNGQNQDQSQTEEVIVEISQGEEKDIQEIDHSSKEHAKEVTNGPKIYKH